MSPGLTMERIYDTLKRQIMAGERRPGERLDPVRIAADLNASATPVRDALHRLMGERMVQAWPQDGFHVLVHSEPGLRDLYAWNFDLLSVVLKSAAAARGAGARRDGRAPAPIAGEDHAGDVAGLFHAIALASGNFEHRQAIANVNDRLHAVRRLEVQVVDDADAEIARIAAAWEAREVLALRRLLGGYHRRRIRAVPEIAALMRAAPDACGA